MSAPNSPAKKKQYKPPQSREDGEGELKSNETNEEKALTQANIKTFFSGHNDPMLGVRQEHKNSPEKRKSGAIQQANLTTGRAKEVKEATGESGKTDGEQEERSDSEDEVSVNSVDKKMAASGRLLEWNKKGKELKEQK